MQLSQTLAPQVSARTRARGAAYFGSGAVTQLNIVDGVITATVSGSASYAVRIATPDGLLRGSCTCPYFTDHFEICKHVWAALLAAEARGMPLLPPHVAPRDVDIVPMPVDDPSGLDDDLDDDFDDLMDDDEPWSPSRQPLAPGGAAHRDAKPWQRLLQSITTAASTAPVPARRQVAAGQLAFGIDVEASLAAGALVIELVTRARKADGEWAKPKAVTLTPADVRGFPPGEVQQLLERLLGARPQYDLDAGYPDLGELRRFRLEGAMVPDTLPQLCADGRCFARVLAPADTVAVVTTSATQRAALRSSRWRWTPPPPRQAPPSMWMPLQYDDGPPWRFSATIRRDDGTGAYVVDGHLARGDTRMDVTEPLLVLADGMLVTRTSVARLDDRGAFTWLSALRRGPLTVPIEERLALLDGILTQPPPVDEAPSELKVHVEDHQPRPSLRLTPSLSRPDQLEAELTCTYDGLRVLVNLPRPVVRSADAARFIRRDTNAERAFLETLLGLGFKHEWSQETNGPVPQIAVKHLSRVVRMLLAEQWHVEAKGVTYRKAGSVSMQVTSGIDWFDLDGQADYGGQHASLPVLLAALKRGDAFVTLGDGSMGLLPEEWLRKHGLLAGFASQQGEHLRFKSSQVALLDALLAEQPTATSDEAFARARAELQAFDGITPADPPATFVGTLRGYQKEGLGWLLFLQRFGFGGCLADDMGLGKTIMVLALLARVHDGSRTKKAGRPSLVVAPRSLVFNWRQEAEKFTPGLRVLEYAGSDRTALREAMSDYDLVLTTYGTLRRDAPYLAEIPFDYVVLDESQAIKNAASGSAKATRLLDARHRLALSGTPIENHLGELWSLFEFLNPGVLGGATAFQGMTGRAMDDATVSALARGLRPFILRRTKDQVAPELPRKTEQTLYCELEQPQRVLYDELREHYRRTLLEGADRTVRGGDKLQVLEALLRLRQAACHPGLIDPARVTDTSAKLDVLLPHIAQAVEEGHKTLVFSQFTSFLAILRTRLDADGLTYEYLDGRTRDRQAKVERFQTDPDCKLFLISLKAGGVGLNLTAAEYVFLLDPWWNPAVEAQAIDRAHRIGQARHVFAYRLIAKDTVEERVLELQQHKRKLADAVLSADGSLLKELKREDLELLLS
jgi:superfamily II DNA or RNA helicase